MLKHLNKLKNITSFILNYHCYLSIHMKVNRMRKIPINNGSKDLENMSVMRLNFVGIYIF